MVDSAIDWDAVLKINGGNVELGREMLGMFFQELPDYEAKVTEAVNDGDMTQLQHILHKLQGSCQYCGAKVLKALAKSMSEQAQQGVGSALDGELKILLSEIARVKQAIGEYV